jgi:anti-sigma B factor antagonist
MPTHVSTLILNISASEDATVVKCSGKLIAGATETLKSEVKNLIPRARRIILDLSDLSYMDSSGLGAVVALYVSAKAGGCDLRLVNFTRQVRELLGMTNLLSVFESCGQYFTKMP